MWEKRYRLLIPYLKHCPSHIIPPKTDVSVSMGSDKTVPDPYSSQSGMGNYKRAIFRYNFNFIFKKYTELKFFSNHISAIKWIKRLKLSTPLSILLKELIVFLLTLLNLLYYTINWFLCVKGMYTFVSHSILLIFRI